MLISESAAGTSLRGPLGGEPSQQDAQNGLSLAAHPPCYAAFSKVRKEWQLPAAFKQTVLIKCIEGPRTRPQYSKLWQLLVGCGVWLCVHKQVPVPGVVVSACVCKLGSHMSLFIGAWSSKPH